MVTTGRDLNIITVRLSFGVLPVRWSFGVLPVRWSFGVLLLRLSFGVLPVRLSIFCFLFSCRQWRHRWQWNVHYCPPVRLGARDVTLCVAPSADPLYHVTKADCDDIASCSENIILHNFVLKDHSFTQCLFVNRIKLSIDRANVSEIRSQFKGLLNST